MIIRDALRTDLPGIVEIYNASIPSRLATADLDPISVDSRMLWFEQYNPETRPLWVLEIEGAIAAWVSLSSFYQGRPAYNGTAEVSIYVDPKHQGQGYGKLLVQTIIEQCPNFGVDKLLSMYFDHNERSRRLFTTLGFQEQGHLRNIAVLDGTRRGLVIAVLDLDTLALDKEINPEE